MQKSIEFFNWFSKIGGQLSNFDYNILTSSDDCLKLKKSNLKRSPKEIKRKFNHQFSKTNPF